MTTRAAITFGYTRVSTDDKGQDVATQESAIKAAGHGIAMFFTDEVSGKIAPANREGFARFLKVAKAGDTLIVTALDRLSRNTVDAINLVQGLDSKGIAVISLREQKLSTDTADGKFLLSLYASLAERERGITSERVKQGLERAKEQGKTLGRPGISTEQREQVKVLLAGGAAVAQVTAETGLKKSAVYKIRAELAA